MSPISTAKLNLLLALALTAHLSLGAKTQDQVLSMPNCGDTLPTRWYSGYLKTSSPSRQLHYVYVESESKPDTDPLLIWFNGGPGCSSMLGLIQEHGPCIIDDFETVVKRNPEPWNKRANVLYLENPAGVGFSYAQFAEDLNFTDHSVSVDVFTAVRDFFANWPELLPNKLYITGESYAGIYGPFLALQIHEWNQEVNVQNIHNMRPSKPVYNLAGLIIGNGATDWEYDGEKEYAYTLHKYGLLEDAIYQEFKTLKCTFYYRQLKEVDNDPRCNRILIENIFPVFDTYNIYDVQRKIPKKANTIESKQRLLSAKHFSLLSPNVQSDPFDTPFVTEYLNLDSVRKALHIPDHVQKFEICNDTVLYNYDARFEGSVWIYPILMSKYRLLHYSGNTDCAIPTEGTKKWIAAQNYPVTRAERPYHTDAKFVGHITEFGNFSFATVNGTGHMAPQWKRKEVTELVMKFIHEEEIN